jgi:RNA polymerase sigma-B factor
MGTSETTERRRQRVRELLERLAALPHGDPTRDAVREQLVAEQLPLVHHLAGRFRDRGESMDDLVQVGSIGLLNAIDRFDLSREVEFSTFATPTILGEIKRHFRDRGWAIRVPRRLQELRKTILTESEELTHALGRDPTAQEVADKLGLGLEDILEAMESGLAYSTVSIDPLVEPSDDSLGLAARIGAADPNMALVEERAVLAPALAQLPERDRAILTFRFAEGLTQTQIADRVGISQMHVSRIITRTLAQLRAQLADPAPSTGTSPNRGSSESTRATY